MSYLDALLAFEGNLNIEQGGTPVTPTVSTINVVGATVTYNPSTKIHTLDFSNLYPQLNGGNKVLLTSDGLAATWAQITDNYVASVGWGKLTGVVSVSTTAPLGGGGALTSSRTLTVSSATTGAVGVLQLAGDLGGTGTAPLVLKINSATVPAAGALTTGHVLQVSGGSALTYGYVADGNVSSTAGIAVTKLSTGGANQFIQSNGTTNTWGSMSDTIHGTRGGGTQHSVVTNAAAGFVPSISAATSLLGSTNGTSVGWLTGIGGAFFMDGGIGPGKLTTGGANQFITSNGTTNAWAAMSDTLHGARGGGTQHSTVTSSTSGFAPAASGGNQTVLSIDGSGIIGWNTVTNSQLAGGIAWSKLSGYPTITTTAPLTIGGGASADLSTDRTLAVSGATTGAVGVVQLAGDLQGSATTPTVKSLTGTGGAVAMAVSTLSTTQNELIIKQTGDAGGASAIHVRNRGGEDGLVIENQNGDFTTLKFAGNVTFPIGSVGDGAAIRMEARSGLFTINAGELRIGRLNSPRFIVGYNTQACVTYTDGAAQYVDVAIQAAPAAGKELIQGLTGGQLISRASGGTYDWAITPWSGTGGASQSPKIQRAGGPYSLTAPGSTGITISTILYDTAMPATRLLHGVLIISQRGPSSTTSGWAGLYILIGHSDGSGNLGSLFITASPMTVGPGTGPTVTVGNSGNNLVITINNSGNTGAVTGYWQLEYGWTSAT